MITIYRDDYVLVDVLAFVNALLGDAFPTRSILPAQSSSILRFTFALLARRFHRCL